MKVYVLRYPPLGRIIDFDFEYELIECEPETLFWTEDKASWEAKASIPFRQLRFAERSIMAKHIAAYRLIADGEADYALILEDDAIIVKYFMPILKSRVEILLDSCTSWDFLFIGSGCNLRVPPEHLAFGQYWYKMGHPATKCADSYIITKKAAQACLEELPYSLPIDWELNYILEKRSMSVYWLEPPLVEQGSQNGTYKSSIQLP